MDNKALSDAKYWSIKIAETQKEIASLTTSGTAIVPAQLSYEKRYRLRDLTIELAVFSDLLANTIDLMTIEHQKRPSTLKRIFSKK